MTVHKQPVFHAARLDDLILALFPQRRGSVSTWTRRLAHLVEILLGRPSTYFPVLFHRCWVRARWDPVECDFRIVRQTGELAWRTRRLRQMEGLRIFRSVFPTVRSLVTSFRLKSKHYCVINCFHLPILICR